MAFDVIITSFRMNAPMSPAQTLEELFGFEPDRARSLTRAFPATVIEGTTRVHADIAAEQLREAGAKVEVRARGQVASKIREVAANPRHVEHARTSAEPAAAKTQVKAEPAAADVLQKAAAAAQRLQTRTESLMQAVAPNTGATSAAAQAIEPLATAAPAPSAKVFSTVAMQNIEADLQRFEVTDFGPPPSPVIPHNDWADAFANSTPPPKAEARAASAPSGASGLKVNVGKADLPDIDDLFSPPAPKTAPQSPGAHAVKPKGDALDELFSPPGADTYYKQKAEVSGGGRQGAPTKDGKVRARAPRGADKGWDTAPDPKGLDAGGLDAAAAEGAKSAAGTLLKTALGKAAAGVAALGVVAGAGLTVINAREEAAMEKTQFANSAEGKEQAKVAEIKKRIHPVIRLAPASLAPAFAGILRRQIDKAHHVKIEWDGAPKDVDCMLLADDKKSEARMTKLLRTGEVIEYPEEAAEQFKEQIETLRTAMGKPNKKFTPVCLSVAFLDDSEKTGAELSKVSVDIKDEDEDEDELDDKGEATIGTPTKHETSF